MARPEPLRAPAIAPLALAACLLAPACGGEAAPARTASDASDAARAPGGAAPARAPARAGMRVETELGEIDPAATERAFQGAQGALARCFQEGTARLEVLGGEAAFFLRIGPGGDVRWAYLERSTVGDRETERCMLGALRRVSWPKPRGGDAEVRKAIAFDPSPDVRPAAAWSEDKIGEARAALEEAARPCKEGAPGRYAVTAYVAPGGAVAAAGVAPPSRDGEAKADCVADAVRAARLPSPGSYPAKVSFAL